MDFCMHTREASFALTGSLAKPGMDRFNVYVNASYRYDWEQSLGHSWMKQTEGRPESIFPGRPSVGREEAGRY